MRTEIGQEVGFKDGVERYGRVTKNYATACDVNVWNSDTGQYDRHHVARSRLWDAEPPIDFDPGMAPNGGFWA